MKLQLDARTRRIWIISSLINKYRFAGAANRWRRPFFPPDHRRFWVPSKTNYKAHRPAATTASGTSTIRIIDSNRISSSESLSSLVSSIITGRSRRRLRFVLFSLLDFNYRFSFEKADAFPCYQSSSDSGLNPRKKKDQLNSIGVGWKIGPLCSEISDSFFRPFRSERCKSK